MTHVDPARLVFIDESGFNTSMASTFGWGRIGKRIIEHKPADWGSNLSVIGAIHIDGVLCHQIVEGAVNTDKFITFVERTLCPRLRTHDIVVLDNLRPHKSAAVRELIQQTGASLVFLPPYSPISIPSSQCGALSNEALALWQLEPSTP